MGSTIRWDVMIRGIFLVKGSLLFEAARGHDVDCLCVPKETNVSLVEKNLAMS